MIKCTLAAALVLACAVSLPAAAAAQQSFGPSIEATFGLSTGGGGSFNERGGAAVDAVLAMPLVRTSAGTFVAGLTASGNGKPTSQLVCIDGPGDECIGSYPTFLSLGLVAGVQQPLGRNASARVLAGPAYYQAVDGPDTWGMQGRVDVARPFAPRTAAVFSLRGSVLPSYEGETLRFASLALGLRIQ
jgi:hypothetical protein